VSAPGGLPAVRDQSTIELVPTMVRGAGDRFVVVSRSTRGAVVTGRVGARAIELLRDGWTLGEMKAVLAREHGCAAEEIDVSALLAALWSAGLVRALDGHTVAAHPAPRRGRVGLYIALFILSPLLSLMLRHVPLGIVLWLAHRVFATRHAALARRIDASLQTANLGLTERRRHQLAAENSRNVRRQLVDRAVLGSLSPSRVERWLTTATQVSGLEHVERSAASGKGTLLCGYHMGSYGLLPFILAARGVGLTVLGGFDEQDQAAVVRWTAALSESGLALPVRVVSGKWALRAVAASLARGETVLLYCDRVLRRVDRVTDAARTIRVPFLGTMLHGTTGVARLHLRSGAAVLPTVLIGDGDQRHRVIIEPPLAVEAAGDPGQRAAAVTQEIYCVLERYVRLYPAQWLKWKDFREMTAEEEWAMR
jgi:KDO2-lipid IV(A) lauroyltransferase